MDEKTHKPVDYVELYPPIYQASASTCQGVLHSYSWQSTVYSDDNKGFWREEEQQIMIRLKDPYKTYKDTLERTLEELQNLNPGNTNLTNSNQ